MEKHPRPTTGKRRFQHGPRRGHIMHASAGIAQAAADLYFRLAAGTSAQQQAAEQWREMFLDIRNLASS